MNLQFLKSAFIVCIAVITGVLAANAQEDTDALFIKKIHDQTLSEGNSYNWLAHLSEEIGGRLAGSENAHQAILYTREVLMEYADTVYLQPCTVPYWVRGEEEIVKVTNVPSMADVNLGGLALGNSVGTSPGGVEAEIIEVLTLDEVRSLGRDKIEGKIIFFNRPMDPTMIRTFYAYGGAADQRVNGPAVAAEYGAVATIVRSLTTSLDDVPHTGVTRYKEGVPEIPAIAVSTMDANMLHDLLQKQSVSLYLKTNCQMVDLEKESFNVVAEIKGATHPDEIILVGGHMDSWDVGGGAHDDGAGCVHSMQVFETLRKLDYTPNRTLRCVLFMNEENGLGGALEYAKKSNDNKEFHLAAIESDAGGFTPRGFSCDAQDAQFAGLFKQLLKWDDLLEPYYLSFVKGGSGADISRLKSQNGLLLGFRPDSQRYFDFHHTENDRISAVNERELKLGASAITSLVYLIDKYGLTFTNE